MRQVGGVCELVVLDYFEVQFSAILRRYILPHPQSMIRKLIRSSKNLRIHLKFKFGGILRKLRF